VRTTRVFVALALALLVAASRPAAQGLTYDLFARYLASLREQAGIPGLSAAIVQDGTVVWERGFGLENIENSVPATPDSVYAIGDVTQTFGAVLLLQRCVETGIFQANDRVVRWNPRFPEPETTFGELLSHESSSGPYLYDPGRYRALTAAVEECLDTDYPVAVARDVLDRLAMFDTVPGSDVATAGSRAQGMFPAATLARYQGVLARAAVPYRVDSRGRATRSIHPPTPLTADTGLLSTVRDLARFDDALDDGVLLRRDTREFAWTRQGASPMGSGWFVQAYNGERVVWHFGLSEGAYSALYIKVPARRLSLVLLANSDGLSAPFPLSAGDVTVSPFARIFLLFLG
jgi:CubicO group peptidase (beta-lactamase class C family)